MERLTQTSNSGGVAFTFDLDITCQPSEARKILNLATKLKEYEDLEEQGRLVKFFSYFDILEFGKTVFLTKSEAEAKLKELRGGKE